MRDKNMKSEFPDNGKRFMACQKKTANMAQTVAEYLGSKIVDVAPTDTDA